MKLVKIISAACISVVLGLVFIYSGYTKLVPVIETFEFSFIDAHIGNWYTAPLFARILIGLEFFLGALLILCYNLRFTLRFTIGLLLFFIIYLGVQIAINGNKGNCGCFGEHLSMTPLQGILKNIIMSGMAFAAYKLWHGWKIKYNRIFSAVIFLGAVLVPFIVNPVDYTYSSNNLDEKVNYKLDLDLLYQPEDTSKVEIPRVELRKGKHVLAFLSLTCSHCRIAAKKFRLIKKNNPELPIYFVLNGDRDKLAVFHEDTRSENIPYSFCLGKTFVQLASAHLPRIYYIDNSIVVKKVDYFELNQYEIEEWVNK